MSGEMKNVENHEKGSDVAAEKVVVAVKASREIPKTALIWALTHVVQPGDFITLVVVVPSPGSGRKLWGFQRFAGDCASSHRRRALSVTNSDQELDIREYCSQMIIHLHEVYDPNKINVKIKIVSGSQSGAVAAEAARTQTSWVILDRQLKHEKKRCMEELQCNIVVMKRSHAKVLRLNLVGSPVKKLQVLNYSDDQQSSVKLERIDSSLNPSRGPFVTPSSSPETFTVTERGTSSFSSSDLGTSPFSIAETKNTVKKEVVVVAQSKHDLDLDESSSDDESGNMSSSSSSLQLASPHCQSMLHPGESSRSSNTYSINSRPRVPLDDEAEFGSPISRSDLDFTSSFREAMSLRTVPPATPPLCSICQHKAPIFGKPPRWFPYAELELATGGFSPANFLAEGGYGSVHRGVLPDGQAIAVKQHKLASSQGDREFCSEVEVLSCAQHRNVVMLIGFCIEDGRRLLVYEYICNGSLASHLYGQHGDTLPWTARRKIALGAARGLRYLHEECRVGCIVHRDMRPNNILITHDFEPLVGDFGLARWQPDGSTGVETRVIGTFGYLAPEYAQSGTITEKADVYSFGVVLLELVTGRKAVDINRPKGQQCLTEWARPLLESGAVDQLVDPQLGKDYSNQEAHSVLRAALLCLHRDPQTRPRISQVLRLLEGDLMDDGTSQMMKKYRQHLAQNLQNEHL